MDKQFTFWNANDTAEHITLQFDSGGTIWHLTRDETKSVSEDWNAIGAWDANDTFGAMTVFFDSNAPHLWVAATQLTRNGAKVMAWDDVNATVRDANVTSRATNKVTDPETLMGRERKRSLSLGDTAKGEHGARKFGGRCKLLVDVSAMRRAIAARK